MTGLQAKIFENFSIEELQKEVNEFMKNHDVITSKYSTRKEEFGPLHVIYIVYRA